MSAPPRRIHRLCAPERSEESLRRGCGLRPAGMETPGRSRVVNLERKNIRYLKREEIGEEVDLILIDASFISIEKFLPIFWFF